MRRMARTKATATSRGRRSARSPTRPASRSRRSRACSTAAPTSRTRPARLVLPGRPRARLHARTETRAALSGGRTGLVGVVVPLVYPAYFSVILVGRAEALYEHDMQIVLCPDPPRARPRGVAARPPDARHDRRRRDHAARGVERGAAGAPGRPATGSSSSTRAMPLDERIPSVSAANTSGAAPGDARTCSRSGTDASARSSGPRGWIATEDRSTRLPRGARRRRHPPRPRRSRSSPTSRDRARARRPPRRCSTCPSRRRRSSRSTTTSRSARCSAARARGLTRSGRPLGRRLRRRRAGRRS